MQAIASADALGLAGLTVSMPFKQVVMASLDRVDDAAETIGAVNTVVFAEGRRIGFNTDWYGAVKALEELTPIAGKKVLVIGSGGAAKAIAYGIRSRQGELFNTNRTAEKAAELAAATHGTQLDYEDVHRVISEMDIVINATSAGFMGSNHDQRMERIEFGSHQIVMDIVFSPVETRLLCAAKRQGATVLPGYKMLIHQALMQCRLWLDVSIDDYSVTEQELLKCCGQHLDKE